MSVQSLFIFVFSLFGFRFALRTTEKMCLRRLITRELSRKLSAMFVFLIFASVFFFARSPFFVWCCLFSVILSLEIGQWFVRIHRELKFKSDFLEFWERSILSVRSGKPFRQALTEANRDNEAFTQHRLDKILEFVFFSPHSVHGESDEFSREIIRELIQIDRSSHRCLERMQTLRRNLRLESEFRKKSGQVLRRIRWQSYIFTGLYLALLLFMILNFQFGRIYHFIFLSGAFFAVGLIWIVVGGRNIRWKI